MRAEAFELLWQGTQGKANRLGKERQTKCRSCGEPIIWKPYPTTGKMHPFNLDGTSHFSTCPQAKNWRRKKKAVVSEQQLSLW
jgi:hypothetical protein